MKHIKEPPPPLPNDVPPNVRELIEITLVKNPQLRYKSGGPFADAVAAVRAGRRPPRPSQTGRATPAAIPSSGPSRAAANPTGRVPAARRARPATAGHRSPPPRRTFSSGQRALLWAAGVLGALAIIIAVLIVINSHDENIQPQQSTPTVTDTGTPPSTTSSGSAPAQPSDWTDHAPTSNPGQQSKQALLRWAAALTPPPPVSPARPETPR